MKDLGVCSLMLGLASQTGSGKPSLEAMVFIEVLCSSRYGEPSINPAPLITRGFVASCCSIQVGGYVKNDWGVFVALLPANWRQEMDFRAPTVIANTWRAPFSVHQLWKHLEQWNSGKKCMRGDQEPSVAPTQTLAISWKLHCVFFFTDLHDSCWHLLPMSGNSGLLSLCGPYQEFGLIYTWKTSSHRKPSL